MSARPVFVPRNKRKKKTFFHGAFTGGFSAGYYNTVGSKEGWTPKGAGGDGETSRHERTKKPQQVEDFMDEEDHNQWGGPTSVRREYDQSSKQQTSSLNDLERVVAGTEPPPNMGRKLLRALGWRDGSTSAIVPFDGGAETSSETVVEEESLLTAKRLKRIRVQQSLVSIPTPKLDTCGLGFSPHRNAPEFERHLEKRKKLTQQRARAATGGGGRDVYRTSHLLNSDKDMDDGNSHDHSNHNVSYETVQDFVGSKTVGGFALRDDDDDVYDDIPTTQKTGGALKVDDEEYDTVLYEHNSDEEDGSTPHKPKDGSDFGGVLASWASLHEKTTPSTAKMGSAGMTSDGRPPLVGFLLGGNSDVLKTRGDNHSKRDSKPLRFAGPDVPFEYTLKRHEFGPDEHPDLLADKSRSVQREVLAEQKHAAAVQSLMPPKATKDEGSTQKPMAGTAFAGLATAMKNRFTTGDSNAPSTEVGTAHPVGLHIPKVEDKKEKTTMKYLSQEGATPKERSITITRTVQTFVPEKLLCKRFHVPVPKSVVPPSSTGEQNTGSTEAAFFNDEILKSAAVERGRMVSHNANYKRSSKEEKGEDNEVDDPQVNRPSMDVFKSIFDPDSASSESDEESQQDGDYVQLQAVGGGSMREGVNPVSSETAGFISTDDPLTVQKEASVILETAPTQTPEKTDKRKLGDREDSAEKEKNGNDVERWWRRRKRHRTTSTDESSLDSSDSYKRGKRKKEKRRRHEKKRRKKHKSSRNK